MEIHLIGHASLFVRTSSCRILIDPVFWDPHFEDLADVYPQRLVLEDLVPEFDILIISHRHLDHFDVRTLSSLPKDVGVFIPQDSLMENCLRELGFNRVRMLPSFAEVSLGQAKLLTTRSEGSAKEFGILVADESGVVWNQIDTVVKSDTIAALLSRYPQIDLMLAMWQPMIELNYQTHQSLTFPFSEYTRLLYNISLISPKAVAPGANGFRYRGDASWLNRVVFPVSRERFCKDAKAACPSLKDAVLVLDPGDVVHVEPEGIEKVAGGCPFVRRVSQTIQSYDFSPVKIDDHLVDRNPDGYDLDSMRNVISEAISGDLPEFINSHPMTFLDHRKWEVIYELEVSLPDERRRWVIDFSEEPVRALPQSNPLANFFVYVTASALFGLIRQLKGWDYALLGGYYRTYQKIYQVTPHGLVRPQHCVFSDPLRQRFNYDKQLESVVSNEILRWSSEVLSK
jgi:UDP-MurNAc hydroxylase